MFEIGQHTPNAPGRRDAIRSGSRVVDRFTVRFTSPVGFNGIPGQTETPSLSSTAQDSESIMIHDYVRPSLTLGSSTQPSGQLDGSPGDDVRSPSLHRPVRPAECMGRRLPASQCGVSITVTTDRIMPVLAGHCKRAPHRHGPCWA
jgi:hypothetical protein